MRPLYFVGDIHLGRRPSRLEAPLTALKLTPDQLGPAVALKHLVDDAIEANARAVIFAGDVVDGRRDQFEAYTHLKHAVGRLVDEGVAVFGVAGNHDGLVLPRLADDIAGFRLLGRGGQWECVPVPGDGPDVDLVGWSFDREHVSRDPTLGPDFQQAIAERRDGAVAYGVLHGDLDVTASTYAPVKRAKLDGSGLAGWFLGHIHQPHDLRGARPVGYLGSLVGLDMGETGDRGPWVVVPGRPEATRQVRLGPVAWEIVTVDVTGPSIETSQDVVQRMETAVQDCLTARYDQVPESMKVVVVRVVLTGRRSHDGAVADLMSQVKEPKPFGVGRPQLDVVLYDVHDHTRPLLDLEVLAKQVGPVGELARHIRELEQQGSCELLDVARDVVDDHAPTHWRLPVEDVALSDPHEVLARACWQALERLVATKAAEVGA